MSSLLNELGLDPEDIKWYQLASCKGMNINWFYDEYESNKQHAKQIDQVCLGCPVIKQCYKEGVENKERGVWGGIFLNLGRVDKDNNAHKDTDQWKQLKKLHGKNIV